MKMILVGEILMLKGMEYVDRALVSITNDIIKTTWNITGEKLEEVTSKLMIEIILMVLSIVLKAQIILCLLMHFCFINILV